MKWSRAILVACVLCVVGLLAIPSTAAPAQRFDDVDPSNIFFADIDWMAESGVTSGCSNNPPLFCPDDFVTREQMAAFMRRLATKQVVDADELDGKDSAAFVQVGQKVADADKLDGLDSSAFMKVGQGGVVENADKVDGMHAAQIGSRGNYAATADATDDWGFAVSVTIDAPAAGLLISGGTLDITAGGGEETVVCGIWLSEWDFLAGSLMFTTVNGVDPGNNEGVCASTGAIFVGPGTWELNLFVDTIAGETIGTVQLYAGNIWVQWVPFDGSGAVPTAVTPSRGQLDGSREK